ncbi:MAG: hypothetical protein GX087_08190 [Desulfobulbaceae bacterium]|nr:hypothetical protein [Desulfobulbaceae bacterium]
MESTDELARGVQARDNRVLPLMREAVLIVRMVLHRQLLHSLEARRPELSAAARVQLCGALINNLFGTRPEDAGIVQFAREERQLVEEELRALSVHAGQLRPILTDALRMHTICDEQEGINSTASLLMAKALGLLEEDRPLPLPSTFMLAVRSLAVAEGLVHPIIQQEDAGQPG